MYLRAFILLLDLLKRLLDYMEHRRIVEEAEAAIIRDSLKRAEELALRARAAGARLDHSPDSLRDDPENRLGGRD